MKADYIPLIVGLLVFVSSLVSLRLGLAFGLQSGFVDQVQYSALTGVLIASAVIPTFIAQRWFTPVHSEDMVEINGK